MQDSYNGYASSPMSPAENCFAIIPSDALELAEATKGLYVGMGGDVTLRSLHGQSDVKFVNVPSGAILDVRARAVRATGTTASGIVGLA
ncbi:hypothetical protein B2G71_19195 [Novosphingobium sp. PC22D]|uniref:spike base protein, RCAP_Rcc01079 family n=1 Tax=Novosphingobium sp. PC22D TaxID=1962403 RepID=UPI000BFACE12|nr:hypothetical protein [Novosphingobium sp. PC22D]PEQ11034.1 hypothetical protein B2G71_19195 [Novosphingobium sp. PC22D]